MVGVGVVCVGWLEASTISEVGVVKEEGKGSEGEEEEEGYALLRFEPLLRCTPRVRQLGGGGLCRGILTELGYGACEHKATGAA